MRKYWAHTESAALLTRRLERGALGLLLGLCVVFSLALASAWWRGLDITCGCFGHAASTTVPSALARSVGLGFVAICLLRNPSGKSAT